MIIIIHAFLSFLIYSIKDKGEENSFFFISNGAELWSTLHIMTCDANNLIEE